MFVKARAARAEKKRLEDAERAKQLSGAQRLQARLRRVGSALDSALESALGSPRRGAERAAEDRYRQPAKGGGADPGRL